MMNMTNYEVYEMVSMMLRDGVTYDDLLEKDGLTSIVDFKGNLALNASVSYTDDEHVLMRITVKDIWLPKEDRLVMETNMFAHDYAMVKLFMQQVKALFA